ncbi:MAG: SH3 domain-containing protein [Lachnospiraceae bacterium]
MLKNHRKTTTILLTSGIAILLSACQANTTANKPSPQESLESTSIEQNTTEQTSIIVSDVTEQITVYAGPGTDYLSIETIDKNIIEKAIKIESDWAEIEYKGKRGYVPQKDVPELCTDDIIRLVDSMEENTQPYPVYEKVNTKVALLDETMIYNAPKNSSSELLDAGETVTLIFPEMSPIEMYMQIELDQNGTKRRYYASVLELLSMKHPLLNFDSVKDTNAIISYDGTAYYSSSGEVGSTQDDWKKTKEISIDETGFHTPVSITSIVKSYNVNDAAMAGKFGWRIPEDLQLKNASPKNAVPSNMENIVKYLFEYKLPLTQDSEDNLNLIVELQTCQNENRIVLKAGEPIESLFEQKTVLLRERIAEQMDLTTEEAAKKEDTLIKSMYPRLEQDKTYHMEITFSNEFNETDKGYYLVIDKELHIYALPIIHGATSLNINSGETYGKYATYGENATWDFAECMMQLDDESAASILKLLTENGFEIQGFA